MTSLTPKKAKEAQIPEAKAYNFYSNCVEYDTTLAAIKTMEEHVNQEMYKRAGVEKKNMAGGKLYAVTNSYMENLIY